MYKLTESSISLQYDFDYNKKINILNGILAAVVTNLVNPYYSKFAERLGATDYQIAYLTSLPHFISILAFIPGAILIESLSNKQKTIGGTMLLHKIFFLFIAIIPFLNVNQASLFVLMIGLMNLPGSIGTMGYQASMGDVFCIKERGEAMGLRNKYSSFVGIIITFISGKLLTSIPKTDKDTIKLYQIFFIIAFIVSVFEVISFFKFKGFTNKNKKESNYLSSLKQVLKEIPNNKKFLLFTFASLFFHIGWVGAQPLFNIYTIKILKADENWLAAISIASAISSIWTYTKWPKWADKNGNNVTLAIAIIGMGVTPLLYAVSNQIWLLVLFNVLIGVSVAGTVLLLFNILLEIIPNENRTIYIAIYNTLIAIISGISPILGVKVMDMTNIYIALIAVAVIRLASSIFFYRMK